MTTTTTFDYAGDTYVVSGRFDMHKSPHTDVEEDYDNVRITLDGVDATCFIETDDEFSEVAHAALKAAAMVEWSTETGADDPIHYSGLGFNEDEIPF